MIRLLFSIFLLASPLADLWATDPLAEIREKAPLAAETLTQYHGQLPGSLPRKLHVVYWTPKDREPQPQWRERLSRVMEVTADFYDRELKRCGFEVRRLPLDHAADGLVQIHLVRGVEAYAHYSGDSGSEIRGECLQTLRDAGIAAERETIVIFCNMSTWDPDKRTVRQNSPYYAGGSARSGTAWQVDSLLLDPDLLKETGARLKDGEYGDITVGKYNSIFVGGVIHELGHDLGLPHNRARPEEAALFGTALMGSGNRTFGEELRGESKGTFLTFAHALRLASHPLFTGSDQGLAESPAGEFSKLDIRAEGPVIEVSGRITGTPRIYAVVGYSDPNGGGDYDETSTSAIPDAEGRFHVRFDALAAGRSGEIKLVACHVNGLTTRRGGQGYSVAQDGQADVATAKARLILDPVLKSLRGPDAKTALAALPPAEESAGARLARAIAMRQVVATVPSDKTPADFSEETKRLSLADAKATAASVGWGRPATDRLAEAPFVLAAGSQLFERGIYAHAPARHVFALAGKWAELSGVCGLAEGREGKVVFVIKADGRELWRSKPVVQGDLPGYQVTLTGAQELELVVEDGGNGTNSDWGLWLDPVLSR